MKTTVISLLVVVLIITGLITVVRVNSDTMYTAGINEDTIMHDGLERSFHLFLPSVYNGKENLPLVFVLHGGGGNADYIEDTTGFSKLAEEEGFICVYPNGTGRLKDTFLTWNASDNCCGYALDRDIDDVDFISSLIDHLICHLAVDKDRIYSCGMSNGAMMSYRLACEIPHKLAGVGIVAGALNCECEPAEPISVIQIHGKEDKHVPYEGGSGEYSVEKRTDKSVYFARDYWIERNGCDSEPVTEQIDEVTIEGFKGGRLGTEFKLISIDGFGHAWPGGEYVPATGADTTCSINATEKLWNFFKSHPKRKNPLKEIDNWAYQIQDLWDEKMDKLAESPYDMLIVDRNGSIQGEEGNDDRGDVTKLRNGRKDRLVLAYIDVGQAESYRVYWEDDWEIGSPEWILGLDPDGWDENYCVKFWDEEWEEVILTQFDELIKAGYDGAYLDWLEIYDYELLKNTAEDEGLDPEKELTKFVRIITSHCRKQNPDFLFIAQNASEMGRISGYRNLFDGIAQEAIWFDGTGDPDTTDVEADESTNPQWTAEYIEYLRTWQFFGLPVFHCEYAVEKVDEAFKLGANNGFVTYCSTRPLDELSSTPPNFDAYYRAVDVFHEGEYRPFYLYAPSENLKGIPLVLVLHGGSGNAFSMIHKSGWLELYKDDEFAVAFPNGGLVGFIKGRDSRTWHCGDCLGEANNDDRDVAYIGNVIDSVCERLPVDEQKVFVCGHSMGGMMSHRLACQMAGRIAGIASVAGPLVYSECNPSKLIPILHIHGTDDKVVPFAGGMNKRKICTFPDIHEMSEQIAKRNYAQSKPVEHSISDIATSYYWNGVYPVELIVLNGHGHSLPSKRDHGFSASEYIWCFFSQIE